MENKIRVLNERAFAQAVGLSYAKIKKMRRGGSVLHLRIGRRVLYKFPEHVEAFLSQYEKAA
jgi:hypothetical protein